MEPSPKDGSGEAVRGPRSVASRRRCKRDREGGPRAAREPEVEPARRRDADVFYDRSDLIQRAVGTVKKALLEATVLVVILLLVFLGNLRASLVVAVTLPMAALVTFSMMRLFGMSANLMSLGGLAIAIGLIVDAAVVVVENTVERLNQHAGDKRIPLLHQVYHAAGEVVTPVASGILIICLVFLPLLSLQGLEGKLFAPVALTIVFALSGSLVLSLTLIPVLSSFVLRGGAHKSPILMRVLDAGYRPLLRFCLAHPLPVYIVAAAGVAAMVVAYLAIGKTFMPTMDEGSVIMQTLKLPSINLAASVATDLLIQRRAARKGSGGRARSRTRRLRRAGARSDEPQ